MMDFFRIPETRLLVHKKSMIFQVHLQFAEPGVPDWYATYEKDAILKQDLRVILIFHNLFVHLFWVLFLPFDAF